jgi:SAM-dependent methyltransferase
MRFELFRLLDALYRHTLGRLIPRPHSPDIVDLGDSRRVVLTLLEAELDRLRAAGRTPTYLDVGARRAERETFAQGFDYTGLDLAPDGGRVIAGDICHCPELPDDHYDVVASFDVFEHLERPWDAAAECIRVTRPGGLLVHRTLFAYRYHPSPVDYWRFSAQGLAHLFTRHGNVEPLVSGYDLRIRRRNAKGDPGHLLDVPPRDYLGGFRENWRVLFVGRKRASDGA